MKFMFGETFEKGSKILSSLINCVANKTLRPYFLPKAACLSRQNCIANPKQELVWWIKISAITLCFSKLFLKIG